MVVLERNRPYSAPQLGPSNFNHYVVGAGACVLVPGVPASRFTLNVDLILALLVCMYMSYSSTNVK